MNDLKQLLCTFSNNTQYTDVIKQIQSQYTLFDNKIFIFVNQNNLKEFYLTFNIIKNDHPQRFKGTISIHRKKQTNTLYTLNALNRLIEDENNGVYDKNFQLKWELYRNSIILTNDIGVKIIPLKLFSIVEV